MNFILNMISVVATFIVFSGLIYFILNILVGRLSILNHEISKCFKIKHIIFYSIAIILLFSFTVFYLPWG